MVGIGEVSAVVAIVQVGFSFATALNTYMADLSDAGDDIATLVSDIEATFGQLRDLGKLIDKNEDTKIWSEDGLRNAKKCVTDCEKIIVKLRKLLKKSTASATSEEVSRDEIDVSKLERALWPFIKPQAEVRRRELQSIKQDIMIAYSSYMIQVGTDAERKKFTDDLPKLQRTRALARRQVREAKEHRRRQNSRRRRKLQPRPSSYVPPEPDRRYSSKGVPYGGYGQEDRWSDDGGGSAQDDEEPLVYEDIEDLEREFEEWKIEEEEQKASLEAEKRKIQEEAVETWKQQQIHELEAHRKKREEERASLRAELTKQRVAPQQIEEIINHLHPQEQVDDSLQMLNLTPASDNASSIRSNVGPTAAKSRGRWRGWFRNKSSSSQGSPSASTLVNEAQKISLPDIIKDPTAEGGIAPLKAKYFQRSCGIPPLIESFDVEIPDQYLLSSWIKRQEPQALNPKKFNSVWREFSQLPGDYRFAISQHMNDHSVYVRSDYHDTWIMLHLECMFEKRRRSMFDGGSRKEMVGVYVVMKQKKRPRYLGAEFENMSPIIVSNERRDSRTRHRSGKNDYEPRHNQVHSREDSSRTRDRRSTRESNHSVRRPSREDYYYERRPRDIYFPESQGAEVRQEIEKLERERSIIQRERQSGRERERERNQGQIPLSRSDARSPQRTTLSRQRMNDGPDLRHTHKYVSFARTPSFTHEHSRERERERDSAPYPGFILPIIDPESLSPRPISPLYDINLSPDRRRSNHRRTRSQSRSPSPRPLRRNYTDESYRQLPDPLPAPLPAPFPAQAHLHSFPAYPNRENLAQTGPMPSTQQKQPLPVTIEELSETSDISSSSSDSDSSNDLYDKNNISPPSRRRRGRGRHSPRQETDEELLDKTLKEYINPSSIASLTSAPAPAPAPVSTEDDAGDGNGSAESKPESEVKSAIPTNEHEESNPKT